jgi:pyruvate dehydrogenase complex dehydrogenase (E1) component
MRLGGHDPIKVYAAYKAAVDHTGSPTVILAKTIKGYGLGESGEGKNITHQQKKINDDELMIFRSRFGIPIPTTSCTMRRSTARRRQPRNQYMRSAASSWADTAGAKVRAQAADRR